MKRNVSKTRKINKLIEMIERESGKKVSFNRPQKRSLKQVKINKLVEMIERETGKKVIFEEDDILRKGKDYAVKCNVGGKERYFVEFMDGKPQFTENKKRATVFTKTGFYDLIKGALPMYDPIPVGANSLSEASRDVRHLVKGDPTRIYEDEFDDEDFDDLDDFDDDLLEAKAKSKKSKHKKYPWDKCEKDAEKEYGSKKTADKVCGSIKAKSGK